MPPSRARKRLRLASLAAGAQAASAGPAGASIRSVEAWSVRSNPSAPARLVLAVRSDAGITGYGESTAEPVPGNAVSEALHWGQQLSGRDALSSVAASLALSSAPPAVRGAADIALLDLRGKLIGAPVCDLLAGRTRDKARAMAALPRSSKEGLIDALSAARRQGFRAFSVPLNLPEESPTRGREFFGATEALLQELRAAGADDLVLDCGGRASAAEAAGLAARLQDFHLLWMDEPAGRISDSALKKISHETVTPIGWGRHVTSNSRFQDLLRLQVVDVLRPDVGLNGIDLVRRAAALAESYYTAVAPFHRGGPVGTAAALQIAASVPNFFIQEVSFSTDERERQMHEAICKGTAPGVSDGYFDLPAGPGLGVEVDESALREYAA